MENNKIILSVGQMRQIARHEITFKDILGNVTFEDGAISCPDTYNFTLDDLHQAIKRLSGREKHILALRFYEGKTQMEVSAEVGISQAQVSRLEKSALKQLRKYV